MPILAPSPKFSVRLADGTPAVGYKLYTYTAGTSTPKDTYTDITLGSANTNPVILNASGEADVWLNGAYKFILKTDADATVWTVDEIRDLTSDGIFSNATLNGTLTISSTAVTWSGNPTHSGNHTFTNNVTVKGNTQLGDQSTDTLRIDPNAVTWTNNPTHSGNHAWSGTQTFNGAATFNDPATFALDASIHTFGLQVGNTSRADASTLDYYLEGTWTPGLDFGAATTGWTFSSTGRYTRIGRVLVCHYDITVSAKGGATGNCRLTGLPVAASSDGNQDTLGMGGAVSEFTSMLTNQIFITTRIDTTAGVTTAKLFSVTAAAASMTQLTDAAFQVNSRLKGTFIYSA